jgi:hypothetical protein
MRRLGPPALALLTCSALSLAGTEVKAPPVGDGRVEIVVRVIDDAPEEGYSRNRCHLVAEITNRTATPLAYPSGWVELGWRVEARPLERDEPYAPVPPTRWGAMMSRERGLRQLGAGIAPGETVSVPFDLGRAFDVTLSKAYVVSGRFPYRIDGVERVLDIPRIALSR